MKLLFQRSWRLGQPTIESRIRETALQQTGIFTAQQITQALGPLFPREPRTYLSKRVHQGPCSGSRPESSW